MPNPPRQGPGCPLKIRKNYQKKKGQKLPFLYFFGNFFRIFGGQPGVEDFVFFFRNFFVFPGFRGFWALYHPRGIVTLGGFPRAFWRGNGPLGGGSRPIKEGKRPIEVHGLSSGTQATVENGPSKKAPQQTLPY